MTSIVAGAASSIPQNWSQIDWKQVHRHVYRIQLRIAKAVQEKRWGKVKALQRILTCSTSAKLLAVKMIISNKGVRTAGIDKVLWTTSKQYWRAAFSIITMEITLLQISSRVVSNRLKKGLSCMMGNYHVQFLGGNGS